MGINESKHKEKKLSPKGKNVKTETLFTYNYNNNSPKNDNNISNIIQSPKKQKSKNYEYLFRWREGGNSVSVSGSFCQWQMIEMHKCIDNSFEIYLRLPLGVYQYKYVVDEEWVCSKHEPTIMTNEGIINNYLDMNIEAKKNKYTNDMQLLDLFSFEEPKRAPKEYLRQSRFIHDNNALIVKRYWDFKQRELPQANQWSVNHLTIINNTTVKENKKKKAVIMLAVNCTVRKKHALIVYYKHSTL